MDTSVPEMPACRSTQLDVNRRWPMLSEAARAETVDAIDALHRAELRLHAVLYGVTPAYIGGQGVYFVRVW